MSWLGIESLRFRFATGPAAGAAIDIELSHKDIKVLEGSAAKVAVALEEYQGVSDIDDGFAVGKEQLNFTLTPAARSLGITESQLARQVRDSFFGAEASRQQRGRDELRAYVRLPRRERGTRHTLENLLIRTPQGGEIPLYQAAKVTRGRSYTEIKRRNGQRVVNVTAGCG